MKRPPILWLRLLAALKIGNAARRLGQRTRKRVGASTPGTSPDLRHSASLPQCATKDAPGSLAAILREKMAEAEVAK